MRRVVYLVELILKALVHMDRRRGHTDCGELAHDFGHDLVRGHDERVAAAIDFDADVVRGLEETPPGIRRRAGPRERAHAPRHHLAHRHVVRLTGGRVDAVVRCHRHGAARIRARHAWTGSWRIPGDYSQCRSRRGKLQRTGEGSCREQPYERSTIQRPGYRARFRRHGGPDPTAFFLTHAPG